MGTITDKLNYLSETKDLFKNRLVSLGAKITNQTTFRNYLNWVKNLYSEVSNKTRLAREGIEGNTSQETTTGKNLANYNDNINNSVPNLTITTDSDGYIIVNGTKNVGYPVIVNQVEITDILEDGETYTIWQEDITPSGTSGFSKCENRIRAINTQGQYSNVRTLGRHTNRLAVDKTTFLKYYIDVVLPNNAETYNNYKNRFMLLKGSYNDSDLIEYEPYTNGASPNPDYPQEIVNISGKSDVKVVGKNLLKIDDNTYTNHGITLTIKDNILTFNGTNDGTESIFTISRNIVNTSTNTKLKAFQLGGSVSNAVESRIYCYINWSGMVAVDFTRSTIVTFQQNSAYDRFNIGIKGGTFTNYQVGILVANDIDETTTYEPYQEQSFDLDLKSRNLFDKDSEDVGYVYSNTGKYAVSELWNTSDWIPVDNSNRYALSFKTTGTNNLFFSEFDKDKTFIKRTTTSNLIPTINTKYIRLSYKNDIGTYDIQLEENSTSTNFEPFYDINLCEIDNYKDRIYPLNGKWYLEKKIGKVVLDGSESTLTTHQFGTNSYQVKISNSGSDGSIITAISNSFLGIPYNDRLSAGSNVIYTDTNTLVNTVIRNTSYTSLDDFKTWLASNQPIVYYVLATPTTTEITESNYPTLYNQLNSIQDYLIKYKINKEFMLEYSEPTIEIESEEN